jgi:hypothetical protein
LLMSVTGTARLRVNGRPEALVFWRRPGPAGQSRHGTMTIIVLGASSVSRGLSLEARRPGRHPSQISVTVARMIRDHQRWRRRPQVYTRLGTSKGPRLSPAPLPQSRLKFKFRVRDS